MPNQQESNPIKSYFDNCYKRGQLLGIRSNPLMVDDFTQNKLTFTHNQFFSIFDSVPAGVFESKEDFTTFLINVKNVVPKEAKQLSLAENVFLIPESNTVGYKVEIQVLDNFNQPYAIFTLYTQYLNIHTDFTEVTNVSFVAGNQSYRGKLISAGPYDQIVIEDQESARDRYLNPVKKWIKECQDNLSASLN